VNQYPSKPPLVRYEARTVDGRHTVATATPDQGRRWLVVHRDGRMVSVATAVEAVLIMLRWVAGPEVPDVTILPGGAR
jgi:hypothetical protein